MSGTNAIHGIILVGAIILADSAKGTLGTALGAAAVFLATVNVIGGFVVTDRMLEMFKQRPTTRTPDQATGDPPRARCGGTRAAARHGAGRQATGERRL
jgi:NAD/NADP transhydrogenase alpha subunit